MEKKSVSQIVGELLIKHKLTLGTVESATGGLISNYVTNNPGSSEYYMGSITSYSNELKIKLAGVKPETLETHGAVSSQVAEEMAAGGRAALGVDICISDTGIAGPTGATIGKPLGLFYIGLATSAGTFNRKFIFKGNRLENKNEAAVKALSWVKEILSEVKPQKQKTVLYKIKSVVSCFLEYKGKILIFHRSDQVSTYQDRWAAISGYIENEADDQAYIEIKEETGIDAKDLTFVRKGIVLNVIDHNLKIKWEIHPYMFKLKKSPEIKLDREHSEYKWISPEEIDDYPSVPNLKEALLAVTSKE